MHSIAEIGTNVPAFLGKLWKMVEDPVTNDLIAWSSTGTSFVIKDEIRFARELLPMYYKHNNMASFIRQLNMYGFHKIVSSDAGSMKLEPQDEIKFTHPCFLRGHPYLLDNIKRKIGVSKVSQAQFGEKTPQVINKVIADVRQMKGRQENLDGRLTAMKLENGALWRELSLLRQKHIKQQQIVNKLIQFLVTIVQQNHNTFSVKRKFPRMLQHHNKMSKHHDDVDDHRSNASNSPTGPVIHELDPAEALLETVVDEAGSVSPSEVTDYLLNQSSDENNGMVIGVDMPNAVEESDINNANAETIIGFQEDSLFPSLNSQQQESENNSIHSSTFLFEPTKEIGKNAGVLRPKYFKLITRRPKKNSVSLENTENNQLLVQMSQKQTENNLFQQMQKNQQKLEINQQQINSDEPIQKIQLVNKNPKLQSHNSKKQHFQKNKHTKFQKHLHERLYKNKNQEILKNKEGLQLQRGQKLQLHKRRQEGTLFQQLQSVEKECQASTEPVITIPFETGSSGDVITNTDSLDVEPHLYTEDGGESCTLPVVVEVPPLGGSPAQVSPSTVSSQDVLIGSPMVINNPVMTSRCEPVDSRSPQSSSEMQVACMDESKVTSPSLVTRNEMDNHLETMQTDLDNLKELLQNEGISLDANTLLGYLNDDPLSYNISDPITVESPKENSGSELMAYNPSLFDLTDLIGNEWNLTASPSEEFPNEDSFAEVNTPQFVPQSPSFTTSAKKRKK